MHAEYTEREVRKAAQGTVRAYRSALTTMLERNPYERYYMHSNIKFARSLLSADAQKVCCTTPSGRPGSAPTSGPCFAPRR